MPDTHRTGPVPDQEIRSAEIGPLSLDEIIDRYGGEWILMRVTGHDEEHWPAEGYIVARAASQEELLEAEELAPPPTPGQPYCSFLAQHDIRSGPEYDAAVKRFIAGLVMANPARRGRSWTATWGWISSLGRSA